ncbi:LPS translocon maturation chaperone LptM [Hydrogenophaga sp. BPS33]|uniref:LPS translocon maturation chaperone LptM n=1 Tax=Hydrogenophaga sp. BPS33 TaxID=2651974 RepID=UPI00132043C2|nr:lipoprotein [Hydrogenophaga sp. BPS33]QHE89039.1 lipoprotein [Hydrogenophaga sp. BPS33]
MAIAVASVGALLLSACGQRGPLYLPQTPSPQPSAERPADQTPRTAPNLPTQR